MPTPMNTLTATELLCHQIAIALDDDWTFQPGDTGFYANIIRTRDGLNLLIHSREKTLTISPDIGEKGIDPNYTRPSISIRADQTPASIASSIRRRLLPDATAWWKSRQELLTEQRKEAAALAAFHTEMKKLTGKTPYGTRAKYYGQGWECDPMHSTNTELVLRSLTHEQALALLAAYYELKKGAQHP